MICQTISNEKRWNKLQKSTIKFSNQVVYDEKQLDYSGVFSFLIKKIRMLFYLNNNLIFSY
ncbi:hypothetical protein CMALT394_300210 [Carnobacterium maltaromaticum]|nr:hypothetical protein CMALT394_300210 [Carnobacterium maltaromaticum]